MRFLLFGAAALLWLGASAGCQSPFDPISKSDKIQGLSHFEFSVTWDLWDSDPEYDGVTVELDYYNEFHDGLDFHDKAHNIVIEFWSQQDLGEADEEGTITYHYYTKDQLFFSKTIVYESSDDIIRIPVESYYQYIPDPVAEEDATVTVNKGDVEATCYVVVKIYPPQGYPQTELLQAEADVLIFKPQETENGINQ